MYSSCSLKQALPALQYFAIQTPTEEVFYPLAPIRHLFVHFYNIKLTKWIRGSGSLTPCWWTVVYLKNTDGKMRPEHWWAGSHCQSVRLSVLQFTDTQSLVSELFPKLAVLAY